MIDNTHVRLRASRAPYNRGGFRFLTTQAAAVVAVETLTASQIEALQGDGQISIEFFTPEESEVADLVILAPEVIERTIPTAQPITHPESPVEADPTAIAAAAAAVDPIAPVATGVTLGSPATSEAPSFAAGALTTGGPAVDISTAAAAADATVTTTTAAAAGATEIAGVEVTDAPLAGTGQATQLPTTDLVTGEPIPPAVPAEQLGAPAETAEAVAEDVALAGGAAAVAAAMDTPIDPAAQTGADGDVGAAAAASADPAAPADDTASTARRGGRSGKAAS